MSTLLIKKIAGLNLQTLPICYFAQDAQGKLIDCNQSLVETLGFSSLEQILKLSADLLYTMLKQTATPDWLIRALCRPSKQDRGCPFISLFELRDESGQYEGRYGFCARISPVQRGLTTLFRLRALNFNEPALLNLGTINITLDERIVAITQREFQVALLLLRGKSAKEIAQDLKLSSRTIETYIEKLKIKLNCQKRSELVEKIIQSEIVDVLLKLISTSEQQDSQNLGKIPMHSS